jgi:hypothetical protein
MKNDFVAVGQHFGCAAQLKSSCWVTKMLSYNNKAKLLVNIACITKNCTYGVIFEM